MRVISTKEGNLKLVHILRKGSQMTLIPSLTDSQQIKSSLTCQIEVWSCSNISRTSECFRGVLELCELLQLQSVEQNQQVLKYYHLLLRQPQNATPQNQHYFISDPPPSHIHSNHELNHYVDSCAKYFNICNIAL